MRSAWTLSSPAWFHRSSSWSGTELLTVICGRDAALVRASHDRSSHPSRPNGYWVTPCASNCLTSHTSTPAPTPKRIARLSPDTSCRRVVSCRCVRTFLYIRPETDHVLEEDGDRAETAPAHKVPV